MDSLGAIVFLPREDAAGCLMLEPILFDPAAAWLAAALERAGVDRFLVVCNGGDLPAAQACFPEGTQFVTDDATDAEKQLMEEADRLSISQDEINKLVEKLKGELKNVS